MATRCEQHKTMPDRIVKAQAPPDMKERLLAIGGILYSP
jgi:hypothetical protein